MAIKEWEIWIEGYAVSGNISTASFIGKATGETFEEACRNFREPENIVAPQGGVVITKRGTGLNLDFSYGYPSIWGCRLFDNEAEARESFG